MFKPLSALIGFGVAPTPWYIVPLEYAFCLIFKYHSGVNVMISTFKLTLATLAITGFLHCRPASRLSDPGDPAFQMQAPAIFNVLLKTTKGDILLESRREWAPNGVDRFYNLVRHGYYNNSPLFRIRAGTWAQFGIAADPRVAQVWRTRTIPDDPRVVSNQRGTVAFAFKDPNARTTQVFINLRDNSSTHDTVPFVPFAKVISGMDVADSLYSGYGERSAGGIRGGRQDSAFAGGNRYFKQYFPLLDYIQKASIVK
ncbi:peptidylprolyl isomerase [Segetibacter sp. 3557_3]|uniref:peptidylprolyl isomerase n=1 Tax=Segetibacter sp. 3557_3 TaxID=2547429 RepID=UPI001058ADA3|nr:peptidylprolyl isomerase [Segetibacter sp. 3557_3]TDH27333.1 peptidylprolyl isomerase [Segetibacter sp. 3557_3]